ncbi:PAS domain-containing hybrid sensor histidine kinase/response regulator [Rubellimicrobium aerolatum]|uniref:histidine kinase n=1 Tax=Rubellimicrobium aerolatum TaxID=490979 RepID=A0ABW0S8A3_9RHOB|nr:PAS domain-containing hybrid sensor histidine kinase/response regulator [Rubellimicrobium aerolatum]MBP1804295.1 PAS domain S-box-containing protein [Rubellimicrobium aerolatum]
MPDRSGIPEETADELYDDAPVGYLTLAADGTILRGNRTLAGWLGLPDMTELLGRKLQQILTPGSRIFYETHCAPILRVEPALRQIALDLRRRDGSRLPGLVEWRRIDGPGGALLGHRFMVVDATDRRAYERELLAERERARASAEALARLNAELEARVEARTAELVQLRKMESLGQLTGGVAHDFNNLLTPIVACLDILQRRAALDARNAALVAGAAEAAERARLLVSRLLTFARRQHLEARPVDLAGLVAGLGDLVARAVGPMVDLAIEAEPGLPPARVDPNQLEMALLNLCVNARDAMSGAGPLSIRLDAVEAEAVPGAHLAPGRYLRLRVRDAGIGMAPEILSRAAEPFFTTKAPGRGTGLGLSMAEGLARQSGGALAIDSAPGQGTTVSVLLPEAEAAPAPLPVPPPEPPRPGPARTVLLVDDDALVRAGVADMLRDLGHAVAEAASGAAALDLLDGAAPDLLVTDFAMPGLDGRALVAAARQRHPRLPALLITGFAHLAASELGDLPRLAKPFSQVQLAQAVERAVASVPAAADD